MFLSTVVVVIWVDERRLSPSRNRWPEKRPSLTRHHCIWWSSAVPERNGSVLLCHRSTEMPPFLTGDLRSSGPLQLNWSTVLSKTWGLHFSIKWFDVSVKTLSVGTLFSALSISHAKGCDGEKHAPLPLLRRRKLLFDFKDRLSSTPVHLDHFLTLFAPLTLSLLCYSLLSHRFLKNFSTKMQIAFTAFTQKWVLWCGIFRMWMNLVCPACGHFPIASSHPLVRGQGDVTATWCFFPGTLWGRHWMAWISSAFRTVAAEKITLWLHLRIGQTGFHHSVFPQFVYI